MSRPDRHALYEAAVQGPDWDLDFLERAWRRRHPGRSPRTFREDFCSTAALATAWARRGPERRAWAVDHDPAPLAWARAHRLPFARAAAARVTLVRADVRRHRRPRVDVACALNFSWWVFRRRADLLAYLRAARAGLRPGGVLVLNAFGGTRAERPLVERTRKPAGNAPDGTPLPAFTYVWEQATFDAVDRRLVAHMHFELRDGRRLRRAFTYDWRMWTLPELRDAALEAGFRGFAAWSEGWSASRRTHDGRLQPRRRLDNDDTWIAYAVLDR
ncbi:MAG TPA: class I SAM-dependent methyltransferase [Candidatus Eisenbacteria bacterium]|nr:class I SAM-dependent methyltransferase [Candidatus Eisenbacteria bacterium]